MLKKRMSALAMGAICTSLIFAIAPAISAPRTGEKLDSVPPPETQLVPRTRVLAKSDRINLMLINTTNAAINYQAIGDTQVRTLQGRQTVTLRGIRVPLTLTLDRQDAGLLDVIPKQSDIALDTLEVTLNTTKDLSNDGTTMTIEPNGSVFLY